MEDWRRRRDHALLGLEQEKAPKAREAHAQSILSLFSEDPNRAEELLESVPAFLADAEPGVRRIGLTLASAALPPEDAEPILAAKLSDAAPEVRVQAAGLLADLQFPPARVALARALGDSEFIVRFEAARGMAGLRHAAGLEVLILALENPELRFRAIGALAELRDAKALPALQKLFARWILPAFERTQLAGALAVLGDSQGSAYLLARTRKRFIGDRAFAVELCGEVKAEGALNRLLEILANPKDSARGAAARGLGRLEDERVLPQLAEVLADPRSPLELKVDAAEGLCLMGCDAGRTAVQKAKASTADGALIAELSELLAQ